MVKAIELEAKQPLTEAFIPNYNRMSVGSDPEMFVYDGPTLLPAFEFLPHKSSPVIVKGPHWQSPGNGYQSEAYWDGFQAEFRLPHPYYCLMYFTLYTQLGLKSVLEEARKKNPSAKLSLNSVVRIPKKTLDTAFDPYVELGCEPSFNAYDLKGIQIGNPRELRYRFAGGHMHFGLATDKANIPTSIKMLDKILGIWSIGAAKSFDNPIRRKYYGMAGEYRLPAHGLEYRVMSNFWLSSPLIFHATWEIGRRAMYLAQTPYHDLWVAPDELVVEAIQNGDEKIARRLMELNKPIFMWLFASRGWTEGCAEKLFDVGLNGIESVIDDPTNIESNWLISRMGKDGVVMNPLKEMHPEYTWHGYASQMFPKKG